MRETPSWKAMEQHMNQVQSRCGRNLLPSSGLGLVLAVAFLVMPATADDRPVPGTREKPSGDLLKIDFTLPFSKALAKAKAENRMIFLKPIYGGMDAEGYRDYRCGSW